MNKLRQAHVECVSTEVWWSKVEGSASKLYFYFSIREARNLGIGWRRCVSAITRREVCWVGRANSEIAGVRGSPSRCQRHQDQCAGKTAKVSLRRLG